MCTFSKTRELVTRARNCGHHSHKTPVIYLRTCFLKIDLKKFCFSITSTDPPSFDFSYFIPLRQTSFKNSQIKMSSQTKSIVLNVHDFKPTDIKFMAPKINDRGGKSIAMISTVTNRSLQISTPPMMTWGASDFVDEKTGESDGKYSMSLNFPNSEYSTANTDLFLQKLKDLENLILDKAVENSESWWGEKMSREVCKHTFFPYLKYSKHKDTKKIDYSRPPSIRAKLPFYDGKWGLEIYTPKGELLFPSDDPHLTPISFIPKLSNVACVIQCGGIWIGGKGWGITWKAIQVVVKERETAQVFGRCHVHLSDDADKQAMGITEDQTAAVAAAAPPTKVASTPVSTFVEDSDEDEPTTEPTEVSAEAPLQQPVDVADEEGEDPAAAAVPAAAAPPATVVAPVVAADAPKRKIVKKVVK
jgi:hypothetical protein